MIHSPEKTLLSYLKEHVIPSVYHIAPTKVPTEYLTLSRIGGQMRNIVTDRSLILINCYAEDPARASELVNMCREALLNIRGTDVDGVFVRWWKETSGPYYYPDPDRPHYRYQFSGELDLAFNQ